MTRFLSATSDGLRAFLLVTAVVLAVIGLGTGIGVALQPSNAYGSGWSRFTMRVGAPLQRSTDGTWDGVVKTGHFELLTTVGIESEPALYSHVRLLLKFIERVDRVKLLVHKTSGLVNVRWPPRCYSLTAKTSLAGRRGTECLLERDVYSRRGRWTLHLDLYDTSSDRRAVVRRGERILASFLPVG